VLLPLISYHFFRTGLVGFALLPLIDEGISATFQSCLEFIGTFSAWTAVTASSAFSLSF